MKDEIGRVGLLAAETLCAFAAFVGCDGVLTTWKGNVDK